MFDRMSRRAQQANEDRLGRKGLLLHSLVGSHLPNGPASHCFFYGYVNEAEFRVGQLHECGSTQVDLSTLVDQTFGRAAIRDFYNHAPLRVRDDNLGAEIEKPRRRGELVGIERLAIGHRQAAMLLPIPRRPVCGLTG